MEHSQRELTYHTANTLGVRALAFLFTVGSSGEKFADGYQSVPVNWGISSVRKKGFFKLLSEITGEKP